MTDEQIIECKYKFQSIEKFAGKPYCTLHNETCEFINFVCDKNCQVYEDYKQLKRKEQECEELTSKCSQLRDELNFHIHNMNKQNEALHNENKELKKENEKLKEEVTALNIAYDDLMEVT